MVAFEEGTATLGTATLNANGVATFTTTAPLAVGSHGITAVYDGDENFASSTSSPLNQIIDRGVTLTTLNPSVNLSIFSQPVTFTATVSEKGTVPLRIG